MDMRTTMTGVGQQSLPCLPRFTEYLRAYSSLSRPPNEFDEVEDALYYRMVRQRVLMQMQRNILPHWSEVRYALREGCRHRSVSEKEVNELCRKMLDIGRDFVGFGSPMELVESAVCLVLQVFHDAYYVKQLLGVTSQQMSELANAFGEEAVNYNLVNRAYEHSKIILDVLELGDRQRLFMPFNNSSASEQLKSFVSLIEPDDEEEWGKEFDGLDIDPFAQQNEILVSWDSIVDESAELFNDDKKVSALSFHYNGSTCIDSSAGNFKSINSSHSNACVPSTSKFYNIEWLNSEFTKFIDQYNDSHADPYYMTVESLFETVITWIQMSGKSDDEISVELYNLLGNDCIDMIEKVVKHRRDIESSYRMIYGHELIHNSDSSKSKSQGTHANSGSAFREKRPAISQSVIVQTEEEKNLKKQLRKIEKKINKGVTKDEGVSNGLTMDDIERMRQEREMALVRAMYAPLFSEGSQQTLDRSEYPFVFDSYMEAKSTPAFISGAKMALPMGFIRNDQRRWEEIKIPAPPPPPDNVIENYKLIDVETELDEFGKIAFKGVKRLNRIQSIVFKTAYTTNENMLICAPTGAGKTNVAMLAILHEIKSNATTVRDIDLTKFKIVYIAPMKALAAEMTDNFSKKLAPLGIQVRELTGDMQLSKSEIMSTQILVTTPEKWDVVTRKAKGDVQLLELVRLIIIDEIHLLQSDRGPVVEALVARTKRYVESSQSVIRLIGLSATLPNYKDVAEFLHVNHKKGLFVFDNRFRPVPLTQLFIGCKATQNTQLFNDMDEVLYEKVHEMISKGHQVMVFVHARNATLRTAVSLRDKASKLDDLNVFKCHPEKLVGSEQMMRRARQKHLSELFERGFAIHHAGMLRMDRNLVEKLFRTGVIKVLICTATLAWGVNLPAHSVIIRGTEMYDASQGGYVDISMLDVMQIFGRAGRPQYDNEGHGTIITSHNKLRHYLSLLTSQSPIESNFKKYLTDNMNAEIVSGTITTIDEAIDWIGYTYLFIRMRKNAIVYGITADELKHDKNLVEFRRKLVVYSAEALDKAKMIRYCPEAGTLDPTDLGRTASHYYIKYDTIEKFNEIISDMMTTKDIFSMVAQAQEFFQLKSREDEFGELDELMHRECKLGVAGGVENCHGKVSILMQSFLSRARIDSFSLISDSMFIMQNVNRIIRGLFEYVLKKGWAVIAANLLKISQMFERQMWDYETPLRQFENREISFEVMRKIEDAKLDVHKIRELTADEIGRIVRHQSYGAIIKRCADTLPSVEVNPILKPITRTILMVQLELTPTFRWDDKYHGKVCEMCWIWISDIDSNHVYHSELYKFTKRQVIGREMQKLTFNIPLLDCDNIPTQYIVHVAFDRWLGCDIEVAIPCHNLILPEKYIPYTKLLDLDPLPVTALKNELYESIYKYTHFNPIQTQIFHTLYHMDCNVLLGAPTGSGKTAAAEMAMFRVFNRDTTTKVVYIAPLKALVRERVDDWKVKLERNLGRRVVELTGDVTPDVRAIMAADVIVTTPEKWDGVSRSWQTRKYVRDVGLLIIDEIHLLGEDRGPVLEVIVSRTNFICEHSKQSIRIIGLSTAIANAQDLASWLNIKKNGLYNFKPSVRPVPIEVHVQGYPGKSYCPRMALMNKPTYRAILQHSPEKPVLVFVSSRRQTRLTALDLIAFIAADGKSGKFLHMEETEMRSLINMVKDNNLKFTLAFGIGLHHAGLHERDRSLVEELFSNQKIQILITTATLAWGVNLPAHAVVIKGTEYFDGKLHRYVDFPITDVLQMMGRAGRPQYDTSGVAVILVHDVKKEFYKKFLYEPFPVESSLLGVMADHLNAEIVAGTIKTKQEAIEYLNWTYLFRRVLKNPVYYGLTSIETTDVNAFLSTFIDNTLKTLVDDYCIVIEDDDRTIVPTFLGRIASYYYLNHSTIRLFHEKLNTNDMDCFGVLNTLTNAHEYNELPVRHNEDDLNGQLAKSCPYQVDRNSLDSPHTKANLLLQAHMSRLPLPCVDYFTDLKSVMDQAIRILQSMIDVAAQAALLPTTLRVIALQQMIVQARWLQNSSLLTCLEHINEDNLERIPGEYNSLPTLIALAMKSGYMSFATVMRRAVSDEKAVGETYQTLLRLPFIEVSLSLSRNTAPNVDDEDVVNSNTLIPIDLTMKPLTKRKWIEVEPNTEYTLVGRFNRLTSRKADNTRAIAPKFPKIKDEGWLLVLGEVDKCELVALKRIGFIGSRSRPIVHNLKFTTPSKPGNIIYTMYFVSDSYLGLDQQFDICLCVKCS